MTTTRIATRWHWRSEGRRRARHGAVVELKAVAKLTDAHAAQARAYVRWLGRQPSGILVNFGGAGVEAKRIEM